MMNTHKNMQREPTGFHLEENQNKMPQNASAGQSLFSTLKFFYVLFCGTTPIIMNSFEFLYEKNIIVCGRRPKGTDSIGVGSFLQLMKTQSRVEHLASGRAVLSDKDSFQSRYA